MTRRWCALLGGVLLLASGCAVADDSAADDAASDPQWAVDCADADADVDGEASDFADLALPCLGGDGEHAVGALDGRPVVVALWASWCGPCRDEAPALQRFHEEFESQVAVLGVATQDTQDKARHFAEDFGFTFPSVFDERGQVLRSQGLTALPATFFVDADGATAVSFVEGDLTFDTLSDAAAEHFGVEP